MRLPLSTSIVAGLALALSTAHAQGPPGPSGAFNAEFVPMGGPGGQPLLMSEPVQDELGLSDKQKGQLKKLQASMIQKSREGMETARQEGMDPQEVMQAMAGLRREHDLASSRVLEKPQKARLAQLELQREGMLAVAKSDVATKIKLTSPQSKKVKSILAEMNQARFKAMPAPPGGFGGPGGGPPQGDVAASGGDNNNNNNNAGNGGFFGGGFSPAGMPDFNSDEFKARFAKMAEADKKFRATAGQKIGEILTKDQSEAFEKLLGKPFDFAKLAPASQPAGAPEAATPKADAASPKAEADIPKAAPPAKAKSKTRKDRSS